MGGMVIANNSLLTNSTARSRITPIAPVFVTDMFLNESSARGVCSDDVSALPVLPVESFRRTVCVHRENVSLAELIATSRTDVKSFPQHWYFEASWSINGADTYTSPAAESDLHSPAL